MTLNSAASTRHRFDTHEKSMRYAGALDGTPSHRRELRCIERCLGELPPGSRVLDLPCGTGRLLPFLVSRGFEVLAADSSTHMLERAKELAQEAAIADRCTFAREDVFRVSYGEQAMDAVICNRLFHHFYESETRIQAFRELSRVCRGPIVVSFFCSHSVSSMLFLAKNALRRKPRTDRVPISMSAMVADVAAAGLQVRQAVAAKPLLGKQWYLELRSSSGSH